MFFEHGKYVILGYKPLSDNDETIMRINLVVKR